MKISKQRRSNGAVSTVMFALLLLSSLIIASLALDSTHGLAVKEQLQTACDAGALAGANSLTFDPPSARMIDTANAYATAVTASNKADGLAVSNASPNTTVVITVDASSNPHTVTVQATRMVTTTFARLLGWSQIPVSASSQVSATHGLRSLAANQAFNLAVSLDVVPTKGPEANTPLCSLTGPTAMEQPFTISLNPQNQRNGGWISEWSGNNSEVIYFDSTQVTLNGVQATDVQNLQQGQMLVLPLVVGDINSNNSYIVVGVIGFHVTSVNFPQSITGYLQIPTALHGTPGMPIASITTSQDNVFLNQWVPWKVAMSQ